MIWHKFEQGGNKGKINESMTLKDALQVIRRIR